MKKIILLMLMLSPFANADMDNICIINAPSNTDIMDFIFSDEDTPNIESRIDELECERNNILLLTIPESEITATYLQYASALWCRHDRNEKVVVNLLRCVLYDTKPRNLMVGSF
jgi:hypothetical protein